MDKDENKTAAEAEDEYPIGCGLGVMVAGAAIMAIAWANYSPGYRPIGTGASFLLGGFFILGGLVKVITGVIARLRSRD